MKIQVKVGPSRIAGQGLFAAQHIPRGARILPYVGDKITKAESSRRLAQGNVYIFTFNEQYDIDGKDVKNLARYANHSCNPNCEIILTSRTIWVMALRNIQDGEELTYNYGYDIKDYMEHPCACAAKNCCGYILAKEYWDLITYDVQT